MNEQPAAQLNRAPWQAYLALVVGLVCIATSGIFVRWAGVPGPVAGVYRTLTAVSLMLIPFGLRAGRLRNGTGRPWRLLVLGSIFFGLDMGLWNTAVQYTSVANAVLLGNTAPIWVGLGAILIYHERLLRNFWLGVFLALAGAALIVGTDSLRSQALNIGNGLALTVSLFYAGYMLITQHARTRFDALSYFWLTTLGSLVTLLVLTLVLHQPLVVPPASLLPLLGLGLVTHIGGWLSVNYAQGHVPAAVVAPTMLGQPVVAALLAWWLLGESLSWVQVVGGAVVLAGIYLVHRAHG
jgi:drug/metabolite transporter (DMT)-like permease